MVLYLWTWYPVSDFRFHRSCVHQKLSCFMELPREQEVLSMWTKDGYLSQRQSPPQWWDQGFWNRNIHYNMFSRHLRFDKTRLTTQTYASLASISANFLHTVRHSMVSGYTTSFNLEHNLQCIDGLAKIPEIIYRRYTNPLGTKLVPS